MAGSGDSVNKLIKQAALESRSLMTITTMKEINEIYSRAIDIPNSKIVGSGALYTSMTDLKTALAPKISSGGGGGSASMSSSESLSGVGRSSSNAVNYTREGKLPPAAAASGILPLITEDQRAVIMYIVTNRIQSIDSLPPTILIGDRQRKIYGPGAAAGGEGGIFETVDDLQRLYNAYAPMLIGTLRPPPTAVEYHTPYTVVEPDDAETAIVLYVPSPLPGAIPVMNQRTVQEASAASTDAAVTIDSSAPLRAVLMAVLTPFDVAWGVTKYGVSALMMKLAEKKLAGEKGTLLSEIKKSLDAGELLKVSEIEYWHGVLRILRAELAKDPNDKDPTKRPRVSLIILTNAKKALDAGIKTVTSAYTMLLSYNELVKAYADANVDSAISSSPSTVAPGLDMTPSELKGLECTFLLNYIIFTADARKKAEARENFIAVWSTSDPSIRYTIQAEAATSSPTADGKFMMLVNKLYNMLPFTGGGGASLQKSKSLTLVGGKPLSALISKNEMYLINGAANAIIGKNIECSIYPGLISGFTTYLSQVEMDIPHIQNGKKVAFYKFVEELVTALTTSPAGSNTLSLGTDKRINILEIIEKAERAVAAQRAPAFVFGQGVEGAGKAAKKVTKVASKVISGVGKGLSYGAKAVGSAAKIAGQATNILTKGGVNLSFTGPLLPQHTRIKPYEETMRELQAANAARRAAAAAHASSSGSGGGSLASSAFGGSTLPKLNPAELAAHQSAELAAAAEEEVLAADEQAQLAAIGARVKRRRLGEDDDNTTMNGQGGGYRRRTHKRKHRISRKHKLKPRRRQSTVHRKRRQTRRS
jgi:hypothetical protein